jgi:hypothetical protein
MVFCVNLFSRQPQKIVNEWQLFDILEDGCSSDREKETSAAGKSGKSSRSGSGANVEFSTAAIVVVCSGDSGGPSGGGNGGGDVICARSDEHNMSLNARGSRRRLRYQSTRSTSDSAAASNTPRRREVLLSKISIYIVFMFIICHG